MEPILPEAIPFVGYKTISCILSYRFTTLFRNNNNFQSMNIEYIIPLVTFWNAISSHIAKYRPPEITNNAVSLIHCVSFIIHYNYDYNMNYTIHMSIGFFIYDLLYILRRIYHFERTKRSNECKKQLPFIAHHIAGIYILYSSMTITHGEYILDAYLLLEKSNIMIYVSYYLHKEYTEYRRINAISEFIQLIIYAYYRLFALSGFVYDLRLTLSSYPYMTQLLILLVYSMGYAWSYRLVKKNIRNYYSIMKSINGSGSGSGSTFGSVGKDNIH